MTAFPPPTGPPVTSATMVRPVGSAGTIERGGHPVPTFAPPKPPHDTLPVPAAVGAIAVLVVSLVASKYVLSALVGFGWPVVVYVGILGAVAYGPSLLWCRHASRRWGTGRFFTDVGLLPRWSDLGWGPVLWLSAIGVQVLVGAIVLALDIPLATNTDGLGEASADRTYIVAIVITAVVAAPFVEEIVFRGVVLRGMIGRMPVVAAILLQGVLFGVAHVDPVRGVGNVGLALVLSGVGIALGGGAYLLRRIGPAVIAHAIFNGVVLALALSGVADSLQN